jgi:small conductance mechanosensitive channel
VDLELRFWITDESIERQITLDYAEKVKKALDAAGIQIPFPHLQVFLEETPALKRLAMLRPEALGGIGMDIKVGN